MGSNKFYGYALLLSLLVSACTDVSIPQKEIEAARVITGWCDAEKANLQHVAETGINSKEKYVQLTVSGSKLTDADLLEKAISSSALKANAAVDDAVKKEFPVLRISISTTSNDSINAEYQFSYLAIIESKRKLADSVMVSLTNQDYGKIYHTLHSSIKETVSETDFINLLTSVDEKSGKASAPFSQGFKEVLVDEKYPGYVFYGVIGRDNTKYEIDVVIEKEEASSKVLHISM